MNLKKTDLVKRVLIECPKARNDDFLLILRVWVIELGEFASEEMRRCMRVLLNFYRDGKISNFETIRRCRQKIQEENEELRGTKYNKRQEQGEEVRATIKRTGTK